MSRDYHLFLNDMHRASEKVMKYTEGISQSEFLSDDKTYDAVMRNLEIIGEAARNIPDEIRIVHPAIEWRKVVAVRNIVTHAYFGIDNDIIWDIVRSYIPALYANLQDMKNDNER